MAKAPKPRDFGLNSDHAPFTPADAGRIPPDPAQPFTDEEMRAALMVAAQHFAEVARQANYRKAWEKWYWESGNR